MSDILQSKSKTNQSSQKEQFWVKHIKLKQASGLTRAAYCRTHGLVLCQFSYWEQKLKPAQSKPTLSELHTLLPVKLDATPVGSGNSSVELNTKCMFKFKSGHELMVYDNSVLPLLMSLLRV
jgi:hypothetical protein